MRRRRTQRRRCRRAGRVPSGRNRRGRNGRIAYEQAWKDGVRFSIPHRGGERGRQPTSTIGWYTPRHGQQEVPEVRASWASPGGADL
jgi:hypothetical protein